MFSVFIVWCLYRFIDEVLFNVFTVLSFICNNASFEDLLLHVLEALCSHTCYFLFSMPCAYRLEGLVFTDMLFFSCRDTGFLLELDALCSQTCYFSSVVSLGFFFMLMQSSDFVYFGRCMHIVACSPEHRHTALVASLSPAFFFNYFP